MKKDMKETNNNNISKESKAPETGSAKLSDEELDNVAGGLDILNLVKTVKDIVTK